MFSTSICIYQYNLQDKIHLNQSGYSNATILVVGREIRKRMLRPFLDFPKQGDDRKKVVGLTDYYFLSIIFCVHWKK